MTERSTSQGPAAAAATSSSTVERRTSRRCSGAVVSAAFAAAGAADRRRSRIASTAGRRKSVSLCRFSVQAESERRQSQILAEAADAAAAAAEDNAVDTESQLPFPDYPAKAFFILEQTSVIRHWCLRAITWPYPCCCCLCFSAHTHCTQHGCHPVCLSSCHSIVHCVEAAKRIEQVFGMETDVGQLTQKS